MENEAGVGRERERERERERGSFQRFPAWRNMMILFAKWKSSTFHKLFKYFLLKGSSTTVFDPTKLNKVLALLLCFLSIKRELLDF